MSTAMRNSWNDAPLPQRAVPIAPVIQFPMGRRSSEPENVVRKIGCTGCAMRKACVSSDLNASELLRFEDYAHTRRIKAGQHLYRSGDASVSLYAVHSGFIMTSIITEDGREQVTGFHMLGEVIGVDSIGGGVHTRHLLLHDAVVHSPRTCACQAAHERSRRRSRVLHGRERCEWNIRRGAVPRSPRAQERVASNPSHRGYKDPVRHAPSH